MRFHIGFSKRVSIKKIIEIIGFLFIALLTFFGIYESAHADELTWNNLNDQSNNFSFYKYQYLDYEDNFNVKTDNNLFLNKIGSTNKTLYISNIQSNDTLRQTQFIYAYSNLARNNFSNNIYYSYNYNQIMQELSYKYIPTSNLCENNTTELKSINFKITLTSLFGESNVDLFNVNNDNQEKFLKDVQGLRIIAHSSANNQDYLFPTKCELTNIYNLYSTYTCNNVFNGNSTYPIDYYIIQINNLIPFNNLYSSSNNIDAYITSYSSIYLPYNDSNNTDNVPFKYSCSNELPNLDSGFDLGDDPGGLNDIYNVIKGDYSTTLPGIDTSLTLLKLPTTFTDLLLLPFDVVQAVINNSSQCEPYDIDLSSIIHKWGNPINDYHLRLPCMREVLSSKLGTWYTIADMLICFFVFYEITMHIINLISAITSGEDLFSYFFRPSNSKVKLVDSSTGEVISRG